MKSALFAGTVLIAVTAQRVAVAQALEVLDLAHSQYVADAVNVEDMIAISDHWAIGCGLESFNPGRLYLFNTANNSVKDLLPEMSERPQEQWGGIFPGCPSPPNYTNMVPHGMDYYAEKQRLYFASHGGREAIEVFNVSFGSGDEAEPALTWTGCVLSPPNSYVDAVAALDNDEILATELHSADDATGDMEAMQNGSQIGFVLHWSAASGFTSLNNVPGATIDGPNGILATRDGATVYLCNWGRMTIERWDRTTGDSNNNTTRSRYNVTRKQLLSFWPDNIRWTPNKDGIYVGGQNAEIFQDFVTCSVTTASKCPDVFFQVGLVDPETLHTDIIVPIGNYSDMRSGTGAIRSSNKLWLTSYLNVGIVYIPYLNSSS